MIRLDLPWMPRCASFKSPSSGGHNRRCGVRLSQANMNSKVQGGSSIVTLTLGFILAIIALICGVLMLFSGRWSRLPLAAIAIICLALNESGLLSGVAR
jgi:hypothetical protein